MSTAWRGLGWIALVVIGVALVGCASSGTRSSDSTPPAAPQPPVQPATPPPSPPPVEQPEPSAEPEPVSGAYGPKTVVIEPAEAAEEEESETLVAAARRAKEARAGEPPIAVITDENLPEYATGELSIAKEKPEQPSTETKAAEEPETEAEEERGEEYWRERVRGARMRWRDLIEEVARLEEEVAELRQRFYAEDDGFYRDSQIKPAWDRALDRLAETQDEVGRAQENLALILEEGRRAGALPGWLREGIEYEPPEEEPEEGPGVHEITEPPVLDEDDGGARP